MSNEEPTLIDTEDVDGYGPSEAEERSLRDLLRSGDFCPWCRSQNVVDRSDSDLDAEEFDWLCRDCGFLWKADGVDVTPPTKEPPSHV